MGKAVSRIVENIVFFCQEESTTPMITVSVQNLCNGAWNNHKWRLKDEEDFDPSWELILDDFRQIELFMTTSQFLAHFSDLIENLLLGCKEAMSDEVHQDFVDFIVKQTENVIQEEYTEEEESSACRQIPLYLKREDPLKNRKTQMVFLMVIRTSHLERRERRAEKESKWETFIKLQLSSDKQKPPEAERPRRCCRENQWQLPSNLGIFASLDPT